MSSRVTNEMRDRHSQILNELANHFDPVINKHEYEQLRNRCRVYLSRLAMQQSTSLLEMLEMLEMKGIVSLFDYSKLKDIVKDFDVRLLEKIEIAEDDIKSLREAQSSAVSSRPVGLPPGTVQNDAYPPTMRMTGTNAVPTPNTGACALPPAQPMEPNPDHQMENSNPSERKRKRVGGASNDVYSCDKKGLLVILNFTKNRAGATEDSNKLKDFFDSTLHWDIKSKGDPTYEQIHQYLTYIQQILEHESDQYYCVVIAVMGHGNQVGIFPDSYKEGDQVFDYEKIFGYFKNDEIPAFAGKPKLFLIQSCRGMNIQGVVQADDEPMEEDVPAIPVRIAIPVDANLLMMWATTPGFKAFRNALDGSHFVQEVLKQFSENYQEEHVEDMLTKVRYQFANTHQYRRQSSSGEGGGRCFSRQMPCSWTTLTRKLYLKKYEG